MIFFLNFKLVNLVLFITLIVLVSCSGTKKEFHLNEEITYEVVRIVDGDTYLLKDDNGTEEKIRIIGANTPETKHPKKGKEPFGAEATAFAKKYLSKKKVQLKFEKGKVDRYNRILAHVYIEGIHFNKMLLDSGMAKTMFYAPNFEFKTTFKTAQKNAKIKKIGIWGLEK